MQAIVLAAGKGTRMRSDLPKVLHPLAGVPLVTYPLRALASLDVDRVVVVVGFQAQYVRAAVCEAVGDVPPDWLHFALQAPQNGTGHAVLCAVPELAGDGAVLIVSGDVPLLRTQTLAGLARAQAEPGVVLAVATFRPPDPTGYGRILRNRAGMVIGIREERDASQLERQIGECNSGIYCVAASLLQEQLPRLGSSNAQGEIYLTDLVEIAAKVGSVASVHVEPREVAGINTPEQLEELERELARRTPE